MSLADSTCAGDNRPAWLSAGHVVLDRRGAAMVLVALELARRSRQVRDGDAALSADFAWIYETCRIAAGSFPPATADRAVRVILPSSEAVLTTAKAAAILGQTVQAVRKAAQAGRHGATRHGRVWVLNEVQVRQAAGKRRRHGKQRAQPGADPGRGQVREGDSDQRPEVGTQGRTGR